MAKTQSAIKSGVGMNALFKGKTDLKPVPDPVDEELEVPAPQPPEPEPDPEPAPPEPEPAPVGQGGEDPLDVLDQVVVPDPESIAARRPRRRRQTNTVRSHVALPEELLQRTKSQLRPVHTGATRTLGVGLLFQGYIRAIDELGLEIDLEGIEAGMDDEVTDRVRAALELWAAR